MRRWAPGQARSAPPCGASTRDGRRSLRDGPASLVSSGRLGCLRPWSCASSEGRRPSSWRCRSSSRGRGGRGRPARRGAQPARSARRRGRLAGRVGPDRARLGRGRGRPRARRRRGRVRGGRRGHRAAVLDWGDDPRVLGPGFRSWAGPTTARSPSRCGCPRPVSSRSRRVRVRARRRAPAGRPDGLARALHLRPADLGGERARPGAGGGTSTFAVQFARAAGARVFVTSGSADKLARSHGARRGGRLRLPRGRLGAGSRRAQRRRRRSRDRLGRHLAVERRLPACGRPRGCLRQHRQPDDGARRPRPSTSGSSTWSGR